MTLSMINSDTLHWKQIQWWWRYRLTYYFAFNACFLFVALTLTSCWFLLILEVGASVLTHSSNLTIQAPLRTVNTYSWIFWLELQALVSACLGHRTKRFNPPSWFPMSSPLLHTHANLLYLTQCRPCRTPRSRWIPGREGRHWSSWSSGAHYWRVGVYTLGGVGPHVQTSLEQQIQCLVCLPSDVSNVLIPLQLWVHSDSKGMHLFQHYIFHTVAIWGGLLC